MCYMSPCETVESKFKLYHEEMFRRSDGNSSLILSRGKFHWNVVVAGGDLSLFCCVRSIDSM